MAKQTIDVSFHFNCHIAELLDDVNIVLSAFSGLGG